MKKSGHWRLAGAPRGIRGRGGHLTVERGIEWGGGGSEAQPGAGNPNQGGLEVVGGCWGRARAAYSRATHLHVSGNGVSQEWGRRDHPQGPRVDTGM